MQPIPSPSSSLAPIGKPLLHHVNLDARAVSVFGQFKQLFRVARSLPGIARPPCALSRTGDRTISIGLLPERFLELGERIRRSASALEDGRQHLARRDNRSRCHDMLCARILSVCGCPQRRNALIVLALGKRRQPLNDLDLDVDLILTLNRARMAPLARFEAVYLY